MTQAPWKLPNLILGGTDGFSACPVARMMCRALSVSMKQAIEQFLGTKEYGYLIRSSRIPSQFRVISTVDWRV